MAIEKTVFISYSSSDREIVNHIIHILDSMGVSYWIAPEMIPVGSNYAREIPKAIQNCKVFLLMLSAKSQESIWVEKEIDSAICYKKSIIPFQIDETPLNDMFRFYLNNVQMIPYSKEKKQGIAALKQQLSQLTEATDVDEPKRTDLQINVKSSVKPVSDKETKNVADSKIAIDESKKKQTKRGSVFTMNDIPTECDICGETLVQTGVGIYECVACKKEHYDTFQTIRNYLSEKGPTPALIIEKETGIPRRVIDYYFREEYLEIPRYSQFTVSCSKCGAPIRTGTLCDSCKSGGIISKPSGGMRGSWHTKR